MHLRVEDIARRRIMHEVPEIVRILREEERLRNLQMKSSGCCNNIAISEDDPVDTSNKNISKQKQAENWFNSIIEYADDSIYVLDNNSRYILVNNKLLSQLGCSKEDVLGKTYNDFHSPQETKNFIQKLTWIFEHGGSLKDEQCIDGNWFLRTMSAIKDSVENRITAVLVISKDITDRKKVEQLLQKNAKKYRTMFDFFPQMMLIIDKDGTILDVNEQIKKWLGYESNEILKVNLFDALFFTTKSKKIVKKNFSSGLLNNTIPVYEVEILSKNGKKQIGLVYTSIIRNEQNEIIADLLVISDITKRKHLEEVMKIKDSAINSSINAIILTDLEGNITYANKTFLRMWGYSKDKELLGKSIVKFWKMKGKYLEVLDVLKITGEWVGELTGIRKDHSLFQVQLSANIIKNKSSKPICVMGSFVDITKYNKAVKTVSESEKKFREILEKSLHMTYEFNIKKDLYDYISPSSEKILGYTSKEMMSFTLKQIEQLIHPEDNDRWNQHLKMIINNQNKKDTIQSIEYRIKHKIFGYRWINDTCSGVFDEKNKPIAIIGTIKDITDRKKEWDELVRSEEKYRILAETSADGVFTTDSLGRLTYVNPSFEKICRRQKNQILARPFRNYLVEDSIYFFQQIFIDACKKNEKIENIELELVADDGCIVPIEANIAPLNKETEFSGIICTIRDITQRKEIEDEFKKNERLKTEFMNIVAHELRSPVTPIKGYLDLIIHDAESNEKVKNWAKISLRNTERLLKLVNDILDVSRLDSDTMRFNMEKINPFELCNEIVEDMRIAITNKKLEFKINIPKQLPHIFGDKIRLSQVLKNLIDNSIKFTDAGFIALTVEKKDKFILITVEDTGIGISNNELQKIFTKFYQVYTGEDRNNHGTGLGLFISKEIIKKHNGAIWAESNIGKGSRFIIQLPYINRMTIDF